ncbi:hypothetical protein LTR70_003057 [Exophiala xenobiotica]|uniref:Amidase domain-containing protein n=1 Tax=Lithohypha guttulata TaxID=1690604 RepID=A0ABR0KHA3_9EURO|nr:hypothetical protein LTR24_002710 [Lithohypha guttulata]KAK5323768.1 hypothetical protein LTR70_003057 [Exophiala xenobiotica]
MRSKVEEYVQVDDIFDTAFLSTIIFRGLEPSKLTIAETAQAYLKTLGNQKVTSLSAQELLPGPYIIVKETLRDVWKVVDDAYGTCITTLRPQPGSRPFEPFNLRSADSQFPSFALPSRVKAKAASSSKLSGLRILVKDNIDLEGVKTSNGNRAFYDTYPPREQSAPCVQRLIMQGADVLGKTKMSPFANWEEPIEHIDYQAPWNTRADGHQSPGGSSSGSAMAIASYDWLDVAIGTDTWASVTRPALWAGCFGLRPSMDAVASEGIEPFSPPFDTAGILAASLQTCRDVASEWLTHEALVQRPQPISSIIWPTDYWDNISVKQAQLARKLVESMKASLNVDCEDISFAEAWSKSPPADAHGLSLAEYINDAPPTQCYDAYHATQDFRDKYQELFDRQPYVSPATQSMWEYAKTVTREERNRGFEKMATYAKWLSSHVLTGTHSNTLVILPIEDMKPRYRDQQPDFRRPPQDGISYLGLAPVLKAPLLTVPIDEISYESTITGKTERLPFAVAVMGTPGTDLSLMDNILKVLEHAGISATVKTGKSIYHS